MRKPKTSYLSHYVTCIDDADVNRWTIFCGRSHVVALHLARSTRLTYVRMLLKVEECNAQQHRPPASTVFVCSSINRSLEHAKNRASRLFRFYGRLFKFQARSSRFSNRLKNRLIFLSLSISLDSIFHSFGRD